MEYVHTIIAPKGFAIIVPAIIIAALAFLVIVLTGIIFNTKGITINVSGNTLTVKAILYGKTVPLEEIDINNVRKLDLRSEADNGYKPAFRTNGIGLPGCLIGWTKLRNGNKALAYVTDRENVALIPTKQFDILFSTNDVDGLKKALTK